MSPSENDTDSVLNVLEETLRVDVRDVATEHVSIRTKVHVRDEVVETLLRQDSLDIERVRVDRIVETAPGIREEGDLLIVPVLEEILVVEKRLILREEIRIRRTRQIQPAQQTVRLRREEVLVERASPGLQQPSGLQQPPGAQLQQTMESKTNGNL